MNKKQLLKLIKEWLADYEQTTEHTSDWTINMKDDAYKLLSRVLTELEK